MKSLLTTYLLTVALVVNAQVAFQNNGNVQMHDNASIGFHTNVVNNGTFDSNLGFTGFYSDNILTISGTNRPIFNNVEVDAATHLQLLVSLGVKNEFTFFNGKIITPRDNPEISLDFINHDFYVGEDDFRYTDGYTSVIGSEVFRFPIGDDDRLRPMIINSNNGKSNIFKGAYFYENPENPTTFADQFLTNQRQVFLENISQEEFWDLDGDTETTVTLTWDSFSNINTLTNNIEFLTVVGWSETDNQWVNLGNSAVTGDLNEGQITSNTFIPNNYTVITIGSEFASGTFSNDNYLISPNGDGLNDELVFEGLEQYDTTRLSIFNRWGIPVYETDDYQNDWKGLSEGRLTISAQDALPVGTYFYILQYGNDTLSNERRGWVYVNR